MATITVRGLDDKIKELVCAKAKRNGRSLEAEVRQIIIASTGGDVLYEPLDSPLDVGSQIQALFRGAGEELELPVRAEFQREVDL